MDCEKKLWLVVLSFIFSATYMQRYCVVAELPQPQVPCLFIFGDSLSDSGNNNNLPTAAKVNYFPYGIDFPAGPTGRFTNGRTSVDILTELLGFKDFIPPFANTSGSDIMKGVNYASGAAGIRKETGTHLGDDISLGMQLQNHKAIVSEITKKFGFPDKAQQHLNKCLYYVNIGSNDYINNYFLPEHYPSSRNYTPEQYAVALVQEYANNLKDLHALGARKFALFGIGAVGCLPHQVSIHGKEGSLCVDEENKAALIFNDKLKPIVDGLNKELPNANFIFINIAAAPPLNNMIKIKSPGQDITKCCKVGDNGQCIPNEKPCKHRNLRLFFDAFHPTEMVNQLMARSAYNSPTLNFAYPMDISHLVKL